MNRDFSPMLGSGGIMNFMVFQLYNSNSDYIHTPGIIPVYYQQNMRAEAIIDLPGTPSTWLVQGL